MPIDNFSGSGWSWDDATIEVGSAQINKVLNYSVVDEINILVDETEKDITVTDEINILVDDSTTIINVNDEIIIRVGQ